MKPIIIPKSITDAEKKIKENLKNPQAAGIVMVTKRRYGKVLLQQLVSNTEDVSHTEIKSLPDDQRNKI